jgi:hypothetical protein
VLYFFWPITAIKIVLVLDLSGADASRIQRPERQTPTRWVASGSRLLPSYRTATRQSGSPPGVGCVNAFDDGDQHTPRNESP